MEEKKGMSGIAKIILLVVFLGILTGVFFAGRASGKKAALKKASTPPAPPLPVTEETATAS